jgi:hypothetical protein
MNSHQRVPFQGQRLLLFMQRMQGRYAAMTTPDGLKQRLGD